MNKREIELLKLLSKWVYLENELAKTKKIILHRVYPLAYKYDLLPGSIQEEIVYKVNRAPKHRFSKTTLIHLIAKGSIKKALNFLIEKELIKKVDDQYEFEGFCPVEL